jgi:hypothetical protein
MNLFSIIRYGIYINLFEIIRYGSYICGKLEYSVLFPYPDLSIHVFSIIRYGIYINLFTIIRYGTYICGAWNILFNARIRI